MPMNSRPLIQRLLKWGAFVLAGVLCLGALLDSITNTITLVTLSAAIATTSVVVPLWLLTELVVRLFGIPWGGNPGARPRIRTLGPGVRFGLVGMLALLWLPQLERLLPRDDTLPTLQVEIRNPTTNDIVVATRGEFVLWLPTALYDGIPRVGGRLALVPMQRDDREAIEFVVPAKSSVRCIAEFLNEKRFLAILNSGDADFSLVAQTSLGTRISGNFPFTRAIVGQKYIEWVLEKS